MAALTEPTRRRLRPVRLTDVPLERRRQAARTLIEHARQDGNLMLAVELTQAVEEPSATVYWVAA
jgi:hypothetical protein